MRRRALLRLAALAGGAGIAGCTTDRPRDGTGGGGGNGASPTDSPTDAPTDTPTDSPTATDSASPTDSHTATADEDTPGPTTGPTRTPHHGPESESFEMTDRACGAGENDVTVSFEASAVTVTGTIGGSNGCYVAEQASVVYDEANDSLSVAVRSYEPDDAEMCNQCLVDIDYRAHYEFDGDAPREVQVAHNGRAVASAAHGNSSATPSN